VTKASNLNFLKRPTYVETVGERAEARLCVSVAKAPQALQNRMVPRREKSLREIQLFTNFTPQSERML